MNRTLRLLLLFSCALLTGPFVGFAAPIASGENQDGTISAGTTDSWTFTVAVNDTILGRVGKLSGGASFSPVIRLRGPDNAVIREDSDTADAAVVHRATVAGTYTLSISGFSATHAGTYRVRMLKIPGGFTVPAGDEGGALTNGGNHDGTTLVGDLDAWTFTAAINDGILLRVGKVSGGSSYAPHLRLYGPDGALIKDDADLNDVAITHRATLAGTYTVVVNGYYAGNAGTYRLTYHKVPGTLTVPVGDEGGPMVNGQSYTGTIGVGDIDTYTLAAAVNDSLLFRVGELSGGNSFSPHLRLYGPDGALIRDSAGTDDAAVVHRATLEGVYTVVVNGYYAGNTGTYRLHAVKAPGAFSVPVGDEGGALVNGENHEGTITMGDLDVWSFTAAVNDYVFLRVGETSGGNAFYPHLRLYGPNGALIGDQSENAEAAISHRATLAGTYTVVVNGYYEGNTGGYNLRYYKTPDTFTVPAGDEGGPLTSGQNYSGSTPVGDLDAWTMTAAVNDYLIFRVGEVSGGNAYYPHLRVIGPDGALINDQAENAEAEIAFRATLPGTYTAMVNGYYAGNTGTYRLNALRIPGVHTIPAGDEGGPVANAQNYDGTTVNGDLDPFVFAASVGNALTISITETSGGNAYYPQIRLFGPNGALISNQTDNTAASIAHTTTQAGLFTVVVSGYYAGNVGAYRLTFGGVSAIQSPAIVTQPVSQAVNAGAAATFSVTATGTAPLAYQWRRNGVDLPGATAATLALTNVQAATTGAYTVVVSNAVGSVTSATANLTLAVAVAPTIVVQPISQTTVAGTGVSFSVVANGTAPLAYQWRKDEVPINGATAATLTLNNPQSGDAGLYTVTVTNSAGTIVSTGATLTVTPLIASRISNVSVRTTLAANQVLIVGLSMSGGSKSVLLRAVGPGLGAFGVPGTMPDPKLALYNGNTQVDANDNWGGGTALSADFVSVGAFALPATSLDAALTRPIEGGRTMQVSGSQAGNVIVEAYDLGSANTPRLVNISARNQVGTGSDVMIAGFTIAGTGPKTVLIRAVGPTLAQFGVPGTLVDPKLEVYSGSTKINENDNWAASLGTTFTSVGAFGLTAGSKDAALLITLQPGGYTVQVSGADGGTGEAIVEIYEVTP
ncbi:MAG: immunoglobulin domain-containing protein [Opitutaceae bacterium]